LKQKQDYSDFSLGAGTRLRSPPHYCEKGFENQGPLRICAVLWMLSRLGGSVVEIQRPHFEPNRRLRCSGSVSAILSRCCTYFLSASLFTVMPLVFTVMPLVVLPDFENRANVRVIQSRRSACFPSEAFQRLGISRNTGWHDSEAPNHLRARGNRGAARCGHSDHRWTVFTLIIHRNNVIIT
jgi:hypothetical protein